MAKEYAQDGVHVGHVVVDDPIAGEKIKRGLPEYARASGRGWHDQYRRNRDGFACSLCRQPQAWTFELNVPDIEEEVVNRRWLGNGNFRRAAEPVVDPSIGVTRQHHHTVLVGGFTSR